MSEISPTTTEQKKSPVHEVILTQIHLNLTRLQNENVRGIGHVLKIVTKALLEVLANSHFSEEVKEEILARLNKFERDYSSARHFNLPSVRDAIRR